MVDTCHGGYVMHSAVTKGLYIGYVFQVVVFSITLGHAVCGCQRLGGATTPHSPTDCSIKVLIDCAL